MSWHSSLLKTYKTNYDTSKYEAIHLPLSYISDGIAKIQRLSFQDFMESDERVLLFNGATRNAQLMCSIKQGQIQTIFWNMPKTQESWTFTGKFYIVSAPTLSHRYGSPPRRINIPEAQSANEFWEEERQRQWKRLNLQTRASFTWPSPGELKDGKEGSVYDTKKDIGIEVGFKYMKLECLDEDKTEKSDVITRKGSMVRRGNQEVEKLTKEEELRCVYNAALDNFCLLVFKISNVELFEPSALSPPTRRLFQHLNEKENSWKVIEVNP